MGEIEEHYDEDSCSGNRMTIVLESGCSCNSKKSKNIETIYYEDFCEDCDSLHYFTIKDNKGKLHIDVDAPTVVEYGRNGLIQLMQYHKHGNLHRTGNKPAIIEYYEEGHISSKEFHINGKLHRDDDNPSIILYNKDGSIDSEIYYNNGLKHRDGLKPASISYKNGVKYRYGYYKNGKLLKETEVDEYKIRNLNKNRKNILDKIRLIVDNKDDIL